MNFKTTINERLVGKYVELIPIQQEDAELTLKWRLSEQSRYMNKGATCVKEQESWIVSRPSNEVNFIITLRTGEKIGMLSLIKIDIDGGLAEPSRLLIGESELVKGIPATLEALSLLYQLAFERLELRKLYGVVAENNKNVLTMHVSTGMVVEGRLRKHLKLNGEIMDGIQIGMLSDDYYKIAKKKLASLIKIIGGAYERKNN